MKKNQLILNILCGIGLLLWALCFFFGFNYTQKGALMVSIPVSFFVMAIMGVLVYALKRHSNNEGGNAMLSRNTEILSLVIYVVLALGSAIYVCHFVNVTKNVQTEVQDKASKEIQELGRIFDDSDEPVSGSYLAWVLDEEDNYKRKLEGEGESAGTIEVKARGLEDELITNSGFSDLQSEVIDFLGRCQFSVENWRWITIPKYLDLLETNKADYERRAVECSKKSEYTMSEPYNCNSVHNYSNLDSELKTISFKNFSVIGCLLVLILQFMILLTYISGRPRGEKKIDRYKSRNVRSYGQAVQARPAPSKPRQSDENGNNDDDDDDELES